MKADSKMRELVDRCYYDVMNSPEAYPAKWVESEGLPYWKKRMEEHSYAQKMVELYELIVELDRTFVGMKSDMYKEIKRLAAK